MLTNVLFMLWVRSKRPSCFMGIADIHGMFHNMRTMDDTLNFQSALAELLEKRREWLDSAEMPRLKEEYRILQSSFSGLFKLFLKKGILHEDPYKNEAKIGDLKVPSEGPFSESEKTDEMSLRLSNYESQLDFLVSFYQFSVDFMTMERLKKIVALTKYISWTQISANSPHINTRTLSELAGLIKGGNDQLSSGLLADAFQQLEKSSKIIFRILKDVSDYHREYYKLELRLRVMDSLKFQSDTVMTKKEDTLRQVKRKFAESMTDRPFYPELVDEILKEDYSGEGPSLREDLLKRLTLVNDKPKEEKRAVSFKGTLLDGVRLVASLNFIIDDALKKLDENSNLLESKKNTFMDKLRRILRQMMNREAEEVIYEVEYFDPVQAASKNEALSYSKFHVETERKIRFLAALSNKTTSVAKRLETGTEEQVLAILAKNLEEVQNTHKEMSALDVYFKSETPREDRERMRGIKTELMTIKNGIVKANQKRHEYIAQKEELEQMKKLGIRTDVL